MDVIERDVEIWRLVRDARGCSVRFCLQPSPLWYDKTLTEEEAELFEMLDALRGTTWARLKRYLTEAYPAYRDDLRRLCERKGLPFLDANEWMPTSGWLFCDRVHLTDAGYRALATLLSEWNAR